MKSVPQIKAQIRRCYQLAKELNIPFDVYHWRIKRAIDAVCIAQYGFHAHSQELSRYLKKHPELY